MSDLYFPNKSTVSIVDAVKLHMEEKNLHLLKAFEFMPIDGIWVPGYLHATRKLGKQQHGTLLET